MERLTPNRRNIAHSSVAENPTDSPVTLQTMPIPSIAPNAPEILIVFPQPEPVNDQKRKKSATVPNINRDEHKTLPDALRSVLTQNATQNPQIIFVIVPQPRPVSAVNPNTASEPCNAPSRSDVIQRLVKIEKKPDNQLAAKTHVNLQTMPIPNIGPNAPDFLIAVPQPVPLNDPVSVQSINPDGPEGTNLPEGLQTVVTENITQNQRVIFLVVPQPMPAPA